MSWGSTGSGKISDRRSRRPLYAGEADAILEAARLIYECLSDAQLARLKAGVGEHVKIPTAFAQRLIQGVEGPYIDDAPDWRDEK